MRRLICAFVVRIGINRFSHDVAHFAIPWARSCQYQIVCQVLSNITSWKKLGQFHFILWIWTLTKPRPPDGKWYLAVPWARSGLYQCICNFDQNITYDRSEWARFIFFFFSYLFIFFLFLFRILASAKPRPITIDILVYLGLELVNINAYGFFFFFFFFFFFKIFHTVKEIGLVSFFFWIYTSAGPRPMANDIWRSLGLDIININVYAFVFKYSLWFNSYGQFLLTDYRRTHNFTN